MSDYETDRGLLGQLGAFPPVDEPVTLPADGLVIEDWTSPTQVPPPGEAGSDYVLSPLLASRVRRCTR